MDIIWGVSFAIVGAGIIYFLKNEEEFHDTPTKEIKSTIRKFEDNGYETGIDMILDILKKHEGAYNKHQSLVHSMILLLTSKANPEYNLELLIPEEDGEPLIFIGKQYIDRFTSNATKLDYFLVGIIERELDDVRLGYLIPTQDVYEIRKIVDSFYYRHL